MQRDAARLPLTWQGREGTIAALYWLGRDPTAGGIRRWTARLVSAYDRAPLRTLFATEAIGPLDVWVVVSARWLVMRGSAAPPDAASPVAPPDSGWRGNLLFALLWAGAIIAVARLA